MLTFSGNLDGHHLHDLRIGVPQNLPGFHFKFLLIELISHSIFNVPYL